MDTFNTHYPGLPRIPWGHFSPTRPRPASHRYIVWAAPIPRQNIQCIRLRLPPKPPQERSFSCSVFVCGPAGFARALTVSYASLVGRGPPELSSRCKLRTSECQAVTNRSMRKGLGKPEPPGRSPRALVCLVLHWRQRQGHFSRRWAGLIDWMHTVVIVSRTL